MLFRVSVYLSLFICREIGNTTIDLASRVFVRNTHPMQRARGQRVRGSLTWWNCFERIRPLLQLPAVGCAVSCMAWLGCAFSAPLVVWIVTIALAIYLLWSGSGGIVPAIAWVSLLILSVLVTDIRPEMWLNVRPYRYWARIVTALWLAGAGVAWFLSQHGDLCARYPQGLCRKLRLLSLISMCVGASLGTLLFDIKG